jgi:hypothetical protein
LTEKSRRYEEVVRKSMEVLEVKEEEVVPTLQASKGLKVEFEKLQEKFQEEHSRMVGYKNHLHEQGKLEAELADAVQVVQEVIDLNMEQVLVSELIQNWVGEDRSVTKFCLSLGRYANDLKQALEKLSRQMILTRQFLDNGNTSEEGDDQPTHSTTQEPGLGSTPGVLKEKEAATENQGLKKSSPGGASKENTEEDTNLVQFGQTRAENQETPFLEELLNWTKGAREEFTFASTPITTGFGGGPTFLAWDRKPLQGLEAGKTSPSPKPINLPISKILEDLGKKGTSKDAESK